MTVLKLNPTLQSLSDLSQLDRFFAVDSSAGDKNDINGEVLRDRLCIHVREK